MNRLHVEYGQTVNTVFGNGMVIFKIEGDLKKSKLKLIQAWMEIHQEEIMLNWDLINCGEDIVKIDPLK